MCRKIILEGKGKWKGEMEEHPGMGDSQGKGKSEEMEGLNVRNIN